MIAFFKILQSRAWKLYTVVWFKQKNLNNDTILSNIELGFNPRGGWPGDPPPLVVPLVLAMVQTIEKFKWIEYKFLNNKRNGKKWGRIVWFLRFLIIYMQNKSDELERTVPEHPWQRRCFVNGPRRVREPRAVAPTIGSGCAASVLAEIGGHSVGAASEIRWLHRSSLRVGPLQRLGTGSASGASLGFCARGAISASLNSTCDDVVC